MDDRLRGLEFYTLCALFIVLPTLEAPKSILLTLLILIRGVVLWREHRFFTRAPDTLEWVLVLVLAASLTSTLANLPYPNGFKGFIDTFRNVSLFWVIYTLPLTARNRETLALCIVAGTVIGILGALGEVYLLGTRTALEFHSVGIITQSAIFQGIVSLLVLGLALDKIRRDGWTPPPSVLWGLFALFMLGFDFLMGSRGALLATVIALTFVLVAMGLRRFWPVLGAAAVALGLVIGGMTTTQYQADMQQKAHEILEGRLPESDQIRLGAWRVALKQIESWEDPWLGIGPRNFGSIQLQRFHFEPPLPEGAAYRNHAHNLFLNKLVEEGLLGLAALLALFSLVGWRLVQIRRHGHHDWLWVGTSGALLIPIVAGSFNTPFYQEHALLSMALIAMFMARWRDHA